MGLGGRHNIERLRNLLPLHLVLAVDLGRNIEVFSGLWEQSRAEDRGVGAHDVLMVVNGTGAVRAMEAVDTVTAVALVGVVRRLITLDDVGSGSEDDVENTLGSGRAALFKIGGRVWFIVEGRRKPYSSCSGRECAWSGLAQAPPSPTTFLLQQQPNQATDTVSKPDHFHQSK